MTNQSLLDGGNPHQLAGSPGAIPALTHVPGIGAIAGFQLSAPLVPLIGQIQLPDDLVRRDGGSRNAVSIRASDQSDYYCKGPSLTPDHPYIGINEFLGGRLARCSSLCRLRRRA